MTGPAPDTVVPDAVRPPADQASGPGRSPHPSRDRTIDAVRAYAIAGVVLGHWMVTALVSDPDRPAELTKLNPLGYAPEYAPVTWLLQTLGLFFFAAGFGAARAAGARAAARDPVSGARPTAGNFGAGPGACTGDGSEQRGAPAAGGRRALDWVRWWWARLGRVARPVLVLLACCVPAVGLLSWAAPPATVRTVGWLMFTPLWYLVVYLGLSALTPFLRWSVRRGGFWSLLVPTGVVAVSDLTRASEVPDGLYALTVLSGWCVPYLLGIVLADRRVRTSHGAGLLGLGLAVGAVLIGVAGYPASAVGVPGERWSNLDPPSLFALALAVAQVGAFLLLRPRLEPLLARPVVGAAVTLLDRGAMTFYCWHQPALLLVTFVALPLGPLPGLHGVPEGEWVAYRVGWLPLLVLALAVLWWLMRRHEPARGVRGRAGRRPGGDRPGEANQAPQRPNGPTTNAVATTDRVRCRSGARRSWSRGTR